MAENQRLKVNWKQVRHEWQLEKAEFAESALGIHRNQYYRYEAGGSIPTLENAIRLAQKAKRPVEYIYEIGEPEE